MAQLALNYVGQVVLARLLVPADFGMVALVAVFIGYVAIYSDLGFGSALVQRSELNAEATSAVFRLCLFGATILAGALWTAAPMIERFYRTPGLVTLARLLATAFLASSSSLVPRALMQREMRFRSIARADVLSTALGLLTTIGLALKLKSPIALAMGTLVGATAGSLLTWQSLGRYEWLAARPRLPSGFWHYGLNLLTFTTVNYWARNVDNLLIGKWIGPVPLGLYSRAYSLMLLPINQIVASLNPVILPMLAALQSDRERFRRAYLSSVRAIAFVTFPMMSGLAVTASPFISVVFGENWVGAVPLVEILAWVGLLQSLSNPTGLIYLATGNTSRLLKWGIFGSTACVLALILGAYLGTARSVAAAYLVVNLLLTYPSIAFAGAPIGLSFAQVLKAVSHTILATAAMAGVVVLVDRVLRDNGLAALPRLLIDIAVGTCVYSLLTLAIRNPALGDLNRFISASRPVRE